ncbi:MAG: ANTAR domain-containing response regulator [Anaeroplasmataceae bacterium]
MDLREQTYSVLIVSSSLKFNEQMQTVLPNNTFQIPFIATSVNQAKRILLERDFDIAIINSPLPDDFGTELAIDICHDQDVGVLQFVKSEIYDEIYDKTNEYGVLVVEKPISVKSAYQSVRLVCATRERLSRLKMNNTSSLKDKLEEIKIVDTAKLMLIEHKKLTEEAAHRYIEKRAMDFRITKKQCALDIIDLIKNEVK